MDLHLISNSHIDPVWLWQEAEGLAETLTTFRAAVAFCKEYDELIFCHNEALLYEWVEKHDPITFEEIRKLVSAGKWRIIGGWYLQPDCNMPHAEAMIRQIERGRRYFRDTFGLQPQTAVNFDSFGHSSGLIQILSKSGYKSYLFCRPDQSLLDIPQTPFIWQDQNNYQLMAHRASEHYNSERGKVGDKVLAVVNANKDASPQTVLWGVGDHGGGPTHEDLKSIRKISEDNPQLNLIHSYPERFFRDTISQETNAVLNSSLNPHSPGCYTSQIKLKQHYRKLENELFRTEKIRACAWFKGIREPVSENWKAIVDTMLFCQFHDALPGSAIERVEKELLRKMKVALFNLEQIRQQILFRLAEPKEPAKAEEFPIFIFNPHPFSVTRYFEIEFQPPEPNFDLSIFKIPELLDENKQVIPSQFMKPDSNLDQDFRKRIVFQKQLDAGACIQLTARLVNGQKPPLAADCDLRLLPPEPSTLINLKDIEFHIFEDSADAWGMTMPLFGDSLGRFELMSAANAADFCRLETPELHPMRLLENGQIRKNYQVFYQYRQSVLIANYIVYQTNGIQQFDLEMQLYWMESDRMLKLFIPAQASTQLLREVMNGEESISRNGQEQVMQRWVMGCHKENAWLLLNQGQYGVHAKKEGVYVSVVRSPAYAGHPVEGQKHIVRQDRYTPRMDLGEHHFSFRLIQGKRQEMENIKNREAQLFQQEPPIWIWYPSGKVERGKPEKKRDWIHIADPTVEVLSLRIDQENKRMLIRLRESAGSSLTTTLFLPGVHTNPSIHLHPFEIKNYAWQYTSHDFAETDFLA